LGTVELSPTPTHAGCEGARPLVLPT